ncbi:O-Antigen ligase [bacterium BMS3Bbin11]|nr:O-Antigen ligase [bacterium BMS3Abin11]GBE45198.1 O-Antigen ligase [bacterium BMS3Bbin11]GMT41487.1 MAG: polymerase [bacterium]HDH16527.1 O-antigen ligase family protein [Gammaproteobacteria bacterium]HDZ79320.1 O-antigen ligase family protein [Gammaproteobacteria bacterium]
MNYLFYTLLALFAVLPLPRGSTFDWSWMLMSMVVYVMAAVWLLQYRQGKVSFTRAFKAARFVLLFFIFWLGWNLLQIIPLPMGLLERIAPLSAEMYRLVTPDIASAPISVDVNATREQLITGLAYVLIFTLVLLLVDSMKRLRVFTLWLVVLGVLQAVIASLALFGSQEIYYGSSSAQGTFANRNQLAGFLELNLAIGIGLLLSSMSEYGSRSWRERIRGWAQSLLSRKVRIRIYLAIMVITLVLTHSRMGNTAFFSSMTLAGILALLLMKHSPRPVVILLTSLVIIDILIVSQWFGLDQLQQRFENMKKEEVSLDMRTNTLNRLNTSMQTRALHKDASLTGTGAGTFFVIFPAYQNIWQPGYYQHAHNDYLEFMSDTGWIGILLLAAIVIITFAAAIRAMRKRRHPLMRGMAFSSVMGIISLMIHSTTDFNFHIPANAALFMVILALGWIAFAMPVERHGRTSDQNRKSLF